MFFFCCAADARNYRAQEDRPWNQALGTEEESRASADTDCGRGGVEMTNEQREGLERERESMKNNVTRLCTRL